VSDYSEQNHETIRIDPIVLQNKERNGFNRNWYFLDETDMRIRSTCRLLHIQTKASVLRHKNKSYRFRGIHSTYMEVAWLYECHHGIIAFAEQYTAQLHTRLDYQETLRMSAISKQQILNGAFLTLLMLITFNPGELASLVATLSFSVLNIFAYARKLYCSKTIRLLFQNKMQQRLLNESECSESCKPPIMKYTWSNEIHPNISKQHNKDQN